MRIRAHNFDLLRILAMLQVVIIHCVAMYAEQSNTDRTVLSLTSNFLCNASYPSVPLFVMLTGAFVFTAEHKIELLGFYKKSFRNIVEPTLIWSLIYVLLNVVILYVKAHFSVEPQDFKVPFISLLNGSPYYHLWYMYMIIGLYAVIPLLNRLLYRLSSRYILISGAFLLTISVTTNLPSYLTAWPIQFIGYLGYFLLGYALREGLQSIQLKSSVIASLSLMLAILAWGVSEYQIHKEIEPNLFGYLSPIVAIQTLITYLYFSRLSILSLYPLLKKFAEFSLGIYFVHAGIVVLLLKLSDKYALSLGVIVIPPLIISALLLSYGFVAIKVKLCKLFRITVNF